MPDIGLAKYRELQVLAGCPSTYTPPLFFTRYCRAFLPPYFADTADKISEKTKINFTQLWGWECERLMTSLSISQETGDVSSYTGGGRRGNLAGASSAVSEVFKSSFLRCTAWFHLQGLLSREEFIVYSIKLCPIDLSLWDIQTSAPPDWWPRSDPQPKEISALTEWEQCSQLPQLRVTRVNCLRLKELSYQRARKSELIFRFCRLDIQCGAAVETCAPKFIANSNRPHGLNIRSPNIRSPFLTDQTSINGFLFMTEPR